MILFQTICRRTGHAEYGIYRAAGKTAIARPELTEVDLAICRGQSQRIGNLIHRLDDKLNVFV